MLFLTFIARAADLCVPIGFDPGVTCNQSFDSLSDAVSVASISSGDVIWVDDQLPVSEGIDISVGDFTIRGQNGNNRARLVGTSARAANGAVHVTGGTVRFVHVTFVGETGGRALLVDGGDVTLSQVRVQRDDPQTTTAHSAIALTGGSLTVNNSTQFSEWRTTGGAGHISAEAALTVAGAVFTSGIVTTAEGGGAINFDATAPLSITNTTFTTCSASVSGGAVYIRDTSGATITDSTFTGNTATGTAAAAGGGAIYVHNDGVTVTGSTFDGNTSSNSGGAIRLNQGGQSSTITDSVFIGNEASGAGGAIHLVGGTLTSSGNRFEGNVADANGGAVATASTWTSTDDLFCDNEATDGGAVVFATGADADLVGPVFVRNRATATSGGGAVHHADDASSIDHATFVANRGAGTDRDAGWWAAPGGGVAVTVRNSVFAYHADSAVRAGGGTWENNAFLHNGGNWSGGVTQSAVVDVGEARLNPTPACSRAALAIGAGDSALIDAASDGTDIGAIPWGGPDDVDGDGWHGTSDCAPSDGSVFPGAPVIGGDGTDQDCTGYDECFFDEDGDGYGDDLIDDLDGDLCTGPDESVLGGDCDDKDPTRSPGAVLVADDVSDGFDRDCDGFDECFESLDLDPVGSSLIIPDNGDEICSPAAGEAELSGDCDDQNGARFPGNAEICNGLDDDCDGAIDDADPDVTATLWFEDADGDGFGDDTQPGMPGCTQPSGFVAAGGDCDDEDPTVFEGAPEACPDGIDNDCDTLVDDADPDYTADPVPYWFDGDGDGVGTPATMELVCSGGQSPGFVPASVGLDCDDGDEAVSPLAPEVCDGIDNDCDGAIDDGFASFATYPDLDGDGFGDPAGAIDMCTLPPDRVATGGDCDDDDPTVNPDTDEQCDGIDNNCDGSVDEGMSTVTTYADLDQDGFGDDTTASVECTASADRVERAGDCDDSDPSVYSGAEEQCDAIDHDCDGSTVPDGPCSRATGCQCGAPVVPGGWILAGLVAIVARRRATGSSIR